MTDGRFGAIMNDEICKSVKLNLELIQNLF
jgi:hypothetical protein